MSGYKIVIYYLSYGAFWEGAKIAVGCGVESHSGTHRKTVETTPQHLLPGHRLPVYVILKELEKAWLPTCMSSGRLLTSAASPGLLIALQPFGLVLRHCSFIFLGPSGPKISIILRYCKQKIFEQITRRYCSGLLCRARLLKQMLRKEFSS